MHNGWHAVGVYRQTSAGTLAPERLLSQPYASWFNHDGLALGDIDSDGVDDIVTANHNYGLVVVRHQGSPRPEGPGPWLAATAPAPHATGVATGTRPRVTFGRLMLGATVTSDSVLLLDGRTGGRVPAEVAFDGSAATLTPSRPLQPGAPYQVVLAGVVDQAGAMMPLERIPFTTAPAGRPAYTASGTYIAFPLDLDGNGYEDMFFYGTGATGDSVWLFGPDGRTVVAADVAGTLTPVAGDFDGNGYDDVLWYGPGTATDTMWWNGRGGITAEVVPVNGTYEPAAGDFDRNGYDDILWYGSGSTVDSIWAYGPGGRTIVAESIPGAGHRPVPADFTRDGHADVLWYVPGAGAEGLWRGQPSGFSKGTSARSANLTDYGTRTLDFNGDGFHEAYWFNATTSSFWRSDTTNFVASTPGPAPVAGVRPVTGDFTGDGRDDLYAYVPGTATDILWLGNATGVG
jgi:hypothetical protein